MDQATTIIIVNDTETQRINIESNIVDSRIIESNIVDKQRVIKLVMES